MSDQLAFGHHLPVEFCLCICSHAVGSQQRSSNLCQFGAQDVALGGGFAMHPHQAEDVLSCFAQLQGQFLDFVFQHQFVMGDGFQFGRTSKPVAGVFYFERVHGHALFILFMHTVIEARRMDEG
ncbi:MULTISPECIES: hypothetical protein [unclassified Pseudomonas]|uniref:hypothetical protein n=1 Tax=unclassified Pseudomonas TaxID=196821 RepID=UPI002AC8DFC4|nr:MULTISPECIES: hypothetical protein [unclassified Pseudomonas]MEB0048436.1 hypothetical protein [Pseudomonas sp. Dout3]MEB0098020.1 hypothetical protein [Pseudomonas sp. DC1.2]WPX57046.1 hypothetical protein RHM68_15465 [Pseudomonas sp. DC1.2]